jgi:peptidoglycan/LPS O-acetylase OafA/YrhL
MKKIRYYENLDGLRGIAALMVVICHFFLMPSVIGYVHTDLYGKITKFGQHGVSLFFVLSGFVITRILINNRNENNYFRQFYWRRALRIFPLYYLFLLCWYFVLPLIVAQPIVPFNKQFQFYLYLQNFDWLTGLSETAPLHPFHFWSLAVEEHFYLIWPLVVYLTPTQKLSKVIISIVILIIPVKIFFLSHNISINKITFTRIDQILLGSLLAYYEYTTILNEKKPFLHHCFLFFL